MGAIRHRKEARFIVLWNDFLEICGGDLAGEPQVKIPTAIRAAAALLHWFEWRSRNSSKQIDETHAQFQQDLLHEFGEKAIRDGLHILQERGFITSWPNLKRRNPERRSQIYRFNSAVVQAALDRKNAVSLVHKNTVPKVDIGDESIVPGSVPSPLLGRTPSGFASGVAIEDLFCVATSPPDCAPPSSLGSFLSPFLGGEEGERRGETPSQSRQRPRAARKGKKEETLVDRLPSHQAHKLVESLKRQSRRSTPPSPSPVESTVPGERIDGVNTLSVADPPMPDAIEEVPSPSRRTAA